MSRVNCMRWGSALLLAIGLALCGEQCYLRAKAQLAAYKVPRHVLIAEHDALPFTDTGKIEKRKLRALLEARIAAGEV